MPSKTLPIVSWLEPPEPSSLGRGVLRRLRVINRLSVLAAILNLLSLPVLAASGADLISYGVYALCSLSLLAAPIMTRAGWVTASRYSFAVACVFVSVAYTLLFGNQMLPLFASTAVAPFNIFIRRERAARSLFCLLPVVLLIAFHFTALEPLRPSPAPLLTVLEAFSWMIVLSLLLAHMLFADEETREREAELEAALARAEAASRSKESFLANMSHELRTPMNGVIGMTSLLKRTDLNDDQQRMLDIVHTRERRCRCC